jgi:enoyl-[acyl-carrier protein] reductase I
MRLMLNIDFKGRRALVMGVTNKHSLGWAIADKLRQAGAEMAFSYQGERLLGTLKKLTADAPETPLYECDVTDEDQLRAMLADLGERWGSIDAIVHAIAYAPRTAMEGRYIETTKDDWLMALQVSSYSLLAVAREAESLLSEDASLVTLSYYAAEKVVPKYNVMGIAKSALEGTVRYLAYDLGKKGIRINAVSAGPIKTVAARSIPGFKRMHEAFVAIAPLGRGVSHEEVGNLGAFLLSPLASGITGEVVYVDAGYHVMGMDIVEDEA